MKITYYVPMSKNEPRARLTKPKEKKVEKEIRPRGRPRIKLKRMPRLDLAPGQAKRLAKARELSGYIYHELYLLTGIPTATIYKIEQGALLRGAHTVTIAQLAQALEEDAGWLAFGLGKSLLEEKKKRR